MPFEGLFFDIVVFSWVLGYSSNQRLAISEAVRVIKPGGIIAIGEQWDPTPVELTSKEMLKQRGYTLEGTETKSVRDIDRLLDDYKYERLFSTEPLPQEKNRVGWITGIYRIFK